jgi:hypothetical protein
MRPPKICIEYPAWVDEVVDWERRYASDEERMRLAIELSRENVLRGTGGPFGAAVFESDGGALVSVGMNMVVASNNSALHGEMVAFMAAQARLGVRVGFDEGPVFPQSYEYLTGKGIEVARGVCREEASAVLDFYLRRGGIVYNG